MRQITRQPVRPNLRRRGVGSLEYVMIMGVVFSVLIIVMTYGLELLQFVYAMICGWVSWPFL